LFSDMFGTEKTGFLYPQYPFYREKYGPLNCNQEDPIQEYQKHWICLFMQLSSSPIYIFLIRFIELLLAKYLSYFEKLSFVMKIIR